MTAPLPFTCPSCGELFGFGDDVALLAVFSSVSIFGEPTPCCGALIWGVVDVRPEVLLTVDRWEAPA